MHILTWNIFVGPLGCTRDGRLAEQIAFLQEVDPHVLFLQEVYSDRSLREILRGFPHHHAHYRRRWGPYTLWGSALLLFCPPPWPLVPLLLFLLWTLFRETPPFEFAFGGVGGNLLLSKHAFLRKGWVGLPPRGIDWIRPRATLWADIVDTLPLTLIGVHFSLDTSILPESFEKSIRGRGERCALLGDTNAGRDKMAPLEASSGFHWLPTDNTWVHRNRLTRGFFSLEDHVSDLVLLRGCQGEATALPVYTSDHLPVLASIKCPGDLSKCADSSTSSRKCPEGPSKCADSTTSSRGTRSALPRISED